MILTPPLLCKELGEHFGTENTEELNDVLKLLEQNVLYARIIDFRFELNDGSEVVCSGLFVSYKEFHSIVGLPDDQAPEPYNGGWTFIYPYKDWANGVAEWPQKKYYKKIL